MLKQFRANELSDKTARLAKTASMLDPIHMLQIDEDEIMPFVEHVVEILNEYVSAASALETQMEGPSQDPVDLSVNIPKTQAKDDVPRAQNHFACLLDPTHIGHNL